MELREFRMKFFVFSLSLIAFASANLDPFQAAAIQTRRTLNAIENESTLLSRRRLDTDTPMNCDGAFLGCLKNDKCSKCFEELREYEIDWASVAADTPCAEVISFLHDETICTEINGDAAATTAFCQTFHTCAFWTQGGDGKDSKPAEKKDDIDCDTLKECKWDGQNENFIGDGICHEGMGGCYNTAVCDYDGGDCCEDTCRTPDDSYVKCGHDGYACRNPNSKNCDKSLTLKCKDTDDDSKKDDKAADCQDETIPYRLVMYDSFGDGWDNTNIEIADGNKVVYNGGLKDGSQGTEYICLSKDKTCYHVDVTGGTWGKEVSWDVRGYSEGSTALAQGGAPMSCDFSVVEGGCDDTCLGRSDEDPTKDPGYKEYKEMYKCIEKQCLVQVRLCEDDDDCKDCLKEKVQEKCHTDEPFNAVLDCTMCQCTDKKGSDFCKTRANPGIIVPGDKTPSRNEDCTPGQILDGGAAVMDFSKCTNFDSVGMMITDFDQNNFGDLDLFESCAHKFKAGADNKKALECLQILVDAKEGKAVDEASGKVDTNTVSALANLVYSDGEKFCNCAMRASDKCPLCPSFLHFKTLLYEVLDACMALDEIDCAAWDEFYPQCEKNLESTYGSIDFEKSDEQCKYVKAGCGGVGAFPAFRRLDCAKEIKPVAWDFHNVFVEACGRHEDGGGGDAPTPVAPTPVAPTPVAPSPVAPTPTAPSEPSGSKPYVPPEDRGKDDDKKDYHPPDEDEEKKKKKSHWFRNLVLFSIFGYVGFFVYKKRGEGFNFGSYRRMQRNFGEEDMYSGLAMESSVGFEPAHLPPGPNQMGASMDSSQYTPYSQY